jgi:hypothetical protein
VRQHQCFVPLPPVLDQRHIAMRLRTRLQTQRLLKGGLLKGGLSPTALKHKSPLMPQVFLLLFHPFLRKII